MNRAALSCLILSSCTLLFATSTIARASVLTGSTTATGTKLSPLQANLTATGDVDWAIWNDASGTGGPSFDVTNHKAGGSLQISAITPTGTAAGVRGSGTSISTSFSFTDGTSPASASGANMGLVFATPLNDPTAGEQFSLLGDTTQPLQLSIWAGGFGSGAVSAVGELTLTLGDETLTLFSQTYTGNTPKDGTLFTVIYQPDTSIDRLIVNYSLSGTTSDGNSHAAIQAVSVSAVPEPGSASLLIGVVGCFLARRRRRKG